MNKTSEPSVELDSLQSLHSMEELYRQFNDFNDDLASIEMSQEEYWNTLSKDRQLDVFCSVMRRLTLGELEKNASYRFILYDIFGFGAESYVLAQMAGYMDLHNRIMTKEQYSELYRRKD